MNDERRGNWRRLSVAVGGFDKSAWPDTPRTPGRNSLSQRNVLPQDVEQQRCLPARVAAIHSRRKDRKKKRRVGAPTRPAREDVSRKRFERLRKHSEARDERTYDLQRTLLAARREARAHKRAAIQRSKEERAAFHSALSTRISARQIPFVAALCALYFVGEVSPKNVSVPATVLKDVRQVSICLKEKLRKFICDGRIRYSLGFDSSSRGGKITSICVSYFRANSNAPVVEFVEFRALFGDKAPDYVEMLQQVIRYFNGGIFCGIATDNTNCMSGHNGGVGALLQEKLGRFVRHDTCELHASASVIRVIESVWPPTKGRLSVTQFIYLAWYLLNLDWKMCRTYMEELLKADRESMLTRIKLFLKVAHPNLNLEAAAAKLLESGILQKPEKPSSMRWGTMAATFVYVFRFCDVLSCVFETVREKLGPGGPGSMSAMCMEWVRWSGSKKLRASLALCVDFIENLWKQYDEPVYARNELWDDSNHFQVCFRPKRALDYLVDAETRRSHFTSSDWYRGMMDAFGNAPEVDAFVRNFYDLVCNRIRGNYGRYFSGIYALSGFGDPYFACDCWQAFVSWTGFDIHRETLTHLSVRAQRLKMELGKSKLDVHHQTMFESTATESFFLDAWALVEIIWNKPVSAKLVQDYADAVEHLSLQGNTAAKFIVACRIFLSTTQSIEHTFSTYDNQPSRAKSFKTKASQAAGGAPHATLASARVLIANATQRVHQEITKTQTKKRARIEAKSDIIHATKLVFDDLTFNKEDLQRAKEIDEKMVAPRTSCRNTLSVGHRRKFLDYMDKQAATKAPARKTMNDLLDEGEKLPVSLALECFGSETCLSKAKQSTKGRRPNSIRCTECQRPYHVNCLMASELITKRDMANKTFAESFIGPCCNAELFAELEERERGDSDDGEP